VNAEMAKVAVVLWLVERKPWLLGAPSPTRALEVSGTAAIIAAAKSPEMKASFNNTLPS
jgi:hypothetical protein